MPVLSKMRPVKCWILDRKTLLGEVLEPYHREVDALRFTAIEKLKAQESVGVREIAAALVRPSVTMLETEDGREYLRIVGSLVQQPDEYGWDISWGKSMALWARFAAARKSRASRSLHHCFAAIELVLTEMGRRTQREIREDQRLFSSNLIDLASAILDASISRETEDLLRERDKDRTYAKFC